MRTSESNNCPFQATNMQKKIQRDLNKQKTIFITVLPPEFHVQLPSLPLNLNIYKLKLIISQKSLLPVHLFSASSL